MNNVVMLCGAEPRKVLQAVIDKKVPVILSYFSRGKRHIAKVVISRLGANILEMDVLPREDPQPINIHSNQEISISLKYGYGKFAFESKVIDLKASLEPESGGVIVVNVPTRLELVQRRSYFRVNVPESMKVGTKIWYGRSEGGSEKRSSGNYREGSLVDLSAGGCQVALDCDQKQHFRAGQFVTMEFTPMPYESSFVLEAQIRKVLLTADRGHVCIGLQIIGLESSVEGRESLQRLCDVVENYYQINQGSVKNLEMGGSVMR